MTLTARLEAKFVNYQKDSNSSCTDVAGQIATIEWKRFGEGDKYEQHSVTASLHGQVKYTKPLGTGKKVLK